MNLFINYSVLTILNDYIEWNSLDDKLVKNELWHVYLRTNTELIEAAHLTFLRKHYYCTT